MVWLISVQWYLIKDFEGVSMSRTSQKMATKVSDKSDCEGWRVHFVNATFVFLSSHGHKYEEVRALLHNDTCSTQL